MSEAEMYYRQVNCLTVHEHPILGKKHHEVIEMMEDFNNHLNQAKNNEVLDLVSNRISDQEIKRYRKEGRLSGATKREPFYKLIAQKFDENYEDTDFDILYDC